jgi:hypothetical protein
VAGGALTDWVGRVLGLVTTDGTDDASGGLDATHALTNKATGTRSRQRLDRIGELDAFRNVWVTSLSVRECHVVGPRLAPLDDVGDQFPRRSLDVELLTAVRTRQVDSPHGLWVILGTERGADAIRVVRGPLEHIA